MNNLRNAEIYGYRRKPQRLPSLRGDQIDKRLYVLSIVLILISILLHQPLFLIAGIVMLIILLIIDIWATYCLLEIRYQHHLSEQRVLFGEDITLSISIENAKILPLPLLEIEDSIPRELPIEGNSARPSFKNNQVILETMFSLRWYERVTKNYTVHCTSRGIHKLGPVKLRSSDIFGFVSREMDIELEQYLLVYPLIQPLASFQLPARRPFGDQRSPHRIIEDPLRITGVRDYVYGDSMRRVNWKASARALKLQSKVFEDTTTYTLSIFLNAASHMDTYYGVHPEWQELCICAAASIAEWGFNEGYAVGLYANTAIHTPDIQFHQQPGQEFSLEKTVEEQMKRRRIRLPASRSEEQHKRIMEALARIHAYFGTTLEALLIGERSRLAVGSTVVVITSSISERMTDILTSMRRGGHTIAVLFVGDTPLPARIASIPIYHIGGAETWERLSKLHNHQSSQGTPAKEEKEFSLHL